MDITTHPTIGAIAIPYVEVAKLFAAEFSLYPATVAVDRVDSHGDGCGGGGVGFVRGIHCLVVVR